MKQLLTNPVSAINDAKRSIKQDKVLTVLISEWVLFGLAFAIALQNFGMSAALRVGFAVAVAGAVFTLFGGFLIQIVFTVLGGKGNYWTGLTTSVYENFPLAVGVFLASLLFRVPFIGVFLGALILIVMAITALSIFFRAIKELFRVDIITAWIGISILLLAFFVAIYTSMILFSASSPSILNLMRIW